MTSHIIGCGTDDMGFTECDLCNAYKNDPTGCQEWRRSNNAIVKEVL